MNLRTMKRFLLAILLGLALGAQAFAQYGGTGGTGGGSTSTNGVYTAPKGGYGSNGAAIGAAEPLELELESDTWCCAATARWLAVLSLRATASN